MADWLYREVPHVGAVFAERLETRGARFFEFDREDGELFVWVGRFHFILSRWARVSRTAAVALLAAMVTPFTGMITIGTGAHAAAAVVMVGVGVAMDPSEGSTNDTPVFCETEAMIGWAKDNELLLRNSHEASVCEVRATW